jgi:hypothetical protein
MLVLGLTLMACTGPAQKVDKTPIPAELAPVIVPDSGVATVTVPTSEAPAGVPSTTLGSGTIPNHLLGRRDNGSTMPELRERLKGEA